MNKTYKLKIAGIERDLQFFSVNENIKIAAFILFGDVELTVECAKALLEKAPEHDVVITAEAKSIPLIHEFTKQSGNNEYVIARKSPKIYMEDLLEVKVQSITTKKEQILCIGKKEKDLICGKRVLIVDDVISTGESLLALEELVKAAGGTICGKMAVLAEGDAIGRDDITVLAPLPLFDNEGNPLS